MPTVSCNFDAEFLLKNIVKGIKMMDKFIFLNTKNIPLQTLNSFHQIKS